MSPDYTSQLLSNMLEISSQRQQVLSQNMANANTPGFVRREFAFDQALQDASKSTSSFSTLSSLNEYTSFDESGSFRADGNNINVSRELADMSQNSVFHSLASRAYNMRVKILKSAIR